MSSILVVDDDPGIRTMLTLFLTHKGHSALEATNGQEALDQLRQSAQPPCLILLDLMMPVMSGAEFRSEQQQDPTLAPIPVALISAAENLQELAPALNADICLEKPIDFDSLLQVVERYCTKAV
jgi:CheY-like chemotaxis protein